jgi:hypothetical protein
VAATDIFTFPWPGPGNSEGPVSPEEWIETAQAETPVEPSVALVEERELALLSASPWPGPGDSEA